MSPRMLPTVAALGFLLSGCARSPDPAQQQLQQKTARENAELAQRLSETSSENAALQEQLAQMQRDLAQLKAAPAPAPAPAPAAASADAATTAATTDAPAAAAPAAASTETAATPSPAPAPGTATGKTGKEVATTLKPSGADESKTLRPGWVVEVFPMTYESESDRRNSGSDDLKKWRNFEPPASFSLGSFVNAPSPIKLLAHRKFLKGQNHVQYVASAYFTVQNRGDHVFVLTMADKSRDDSRYLSTVCNLKLALEDQEIINNYLGMLPGREMSLNGGANLIEGLYKTTLTVTCPYVGPQLNTVDLGRLEEIQIAINVRRPNEPSPVELTERDLVYVSQQ